MDIPILEFVMDRLTACKGSWPAIAKQIEPEAWQSYYSWLTKLAQGRIPDPGVNKIQRLADFFRAHPIANEAPAAHFPAAAAGPAALHHPPAASEVPREGHEQTSDIQPLRERRADVASRLPAAPADLRVNGAAEG